MTEKLKPCRMCLERGRPSSFGSEPRCAFLFGVFNRDNWQCATMNTLREAAEETEVYCEDSKAALISWPDEGGGFLLLGWYKSRGTTEYAAKFDYIYGPEPLTLEEAERFITWNRRAE